MKKLSEMIAQAQNIISSNDGVDMQRHECPTLSGFHETLLMYANTFKALEDKGTGKLPDEIVGALLLAFASGAANALAVLKNGLVIRDAEGIAIDRVFYSLDELMNEAELSADAETQLSMLRGDMRDLAKYDYDEDESEEEDEDEYEEETPTPANMKYVH